MGLIPELIILAIIPMSRAHAVNSNQNPQHALAWYNGVKDCYGMDGSFVPCSTYIASPRLSGQLNAYSCEPKDPRNRCIKYLHFEMTKKVSFYTAKKECATMGMQLVSIENRDKWGDVVVGIESVGKGGFWTSGLRDQGKKFVWGNGCSLEFHHWKKTQPDEIAGDDCVMISSTNLEWQNFPCLPAEDRKLGYICESLECRFWPAAWNTSTS